MGTSASNKGPGSGVSFDPPWLDDIELPNFDPNSPSEPQLPDKQQPDDNNTPVAPVLAPPGRFRGARANLSNYIRSGDVRSLRRSLGHYSKTGMGGARNIAKRMRLSTSVGSGLFKALQSVRDGSNPTLADLFQRLKAENANAYQFIDAIVANVCSSGGSLDEVSCRDSVNSALSDYFNKNPDADIGNLKDDDLWLLTSNFLGYEAFSRIQLDIGKAFEDKQVTWSERMARLKDMREYMEAEISTQINKLRNLNGDQSSQSLQKILQAAIASTFSVYEVEI